ncbi:DUF6081 family protein [Micromonospora sp. NPDC049301]|uniref:DUF6081 family protein n=1 Tax=Micromonospora sp. NPDC049301 TaxID=3155723 RepID=UPI0034315D10
MSIESEASTRVAATGEVLRDDFSGPLSVGDETARWRLRPVPGFPAGDGVPRTGPDGLTVVPTATDPATGHPAFAEPPQPLSETDHLRWALMANRDTADGLPGFAVPAGRFTVRAELSVEAYGLDRHTYGDAVVDPYRDLRLGAAALICMDRETGMVFDFIVTDRCVFAVYERLAFPPHGYAGFSYAVPVLDRQPADVHALALTYDADRRTAHWHVGDTEVLRVDRIGRRVLDARYALRDNGRPEESATPRQLTVGLALFADRLWGQGVRLDVRHVTAHRD